MRMIDKLVIMPHKLSMTVTLPPTLAKFVESKMSSGRYESVGEVVRDGLRMLERADSADALRWNAIRADVEEAREAVKTGDVVDGPAFMRSMKRKLTASARSGSHR